MKAVVSHLLTLLKASSQLIVPIYQRPQPLIPRDVAICPRREVSA